MSQIIPPPAPEISRTRPESTPVRTLEREAAYRVAFELVKRIDDNLTRNSCHYRNSSDELLTTLEEVIRAALDNDLVVEFAPKERENIVTDLLRQFYRKRYAVARQQLEAA